MIEVTRLNGDSILINPDLIELIEETPDTVITLTNGKKYVVSETGTKITELIITYRRKIYTNLYNKIEG